MSANVLIILKIIDMIMLGMQLYPQARRAFEKLTEELKQFIEYDEEGNVIGARDPSIEEWNAINAKIDTGLELLRKRHEVLTRDV